MVTFFVFKNPAIDPKCYFLQLSHPWKVTIIIMNVVGPCQILYPSIDHSFFQMWTTHTLSPHFHALFSFHVACSRDQCHFFFPFLCKFRTLCIHSSKGSGRNQDNLFLFSKGEFQTKKRFTPNNPFLIDVDDLLFKGKWGNKKKIYFEKISLLLFGTMGHTCDHFKPSHTYEK